MNEQSDRDGALCPEPVDGAEIEKANHFTWNLRVNVGVELFWGIAMSLVSTATIIPIFLTKLGASERLIALVPGVNMVGWALLQLPSAYFTTRLRRTMAPMIWLHAPIVLAWLGAALVARDLAAERPEAARWVFLSLYAVACLSGGVAIPMWGDFLNRQTPAGTRGRFFGWMFAAGSAAGIAGGLIAQRVLDHFPFPTNFGICFYAAAGAMMVGLLPYMMVREYVEKPTRFSCARAFLSHLKRAVLGSPGLRKLVATRWLMESGIMAWAFFSVRAYAVGDLDDGAAGTFTLIMAASQAPMMVLVGYVGEKLGFRMVMAIGGCCAATATALALLGTSPAWFYVLFMFAGFTVACDLVSTMNLVLELSPDRDKTVYQALYNTLLVPTRIAYPLIAGWLAERYSVRTVFMAALPLQLLGVGAALMLARDGKGAAKPGGEEGVRRSTEPPGSRVAALPEDEPWDDGE